MTSNVEVGQGGGEDVSAKTVLRYAALAYSLPPGHIFQSRIDGLEGFADLSPRRRTSTSAVREFENPDVESPRKATAVALGEKLKQKVPPPRATSVLVLNGNGVEGSASTASYLLGQRGYRMLTPPTGSRRTRPTYDYFRTEVYFDAAQGRARKPAARKLANLFGSADVKKLTPTIRALGNDAMLVAVIGQTFHGRLACGTGRPDAEAAAGERRLGRERGRRPAPRAPARDRLPADGADDDRPLVVDRPRAPIRVYRIDPDKDAQDGPAHVQSMGCNEYWGVQMTDWEDAPVLGGRNFVRKHRRPHVRALLQRPAPAHGRPEDRRRLLLGRQHAARPALERDDDRDREGPAAARQGEVRRSRRVATILPPR